MSSKVMPYMSAPYNHFSAYFKTNIYSQMNCNRMTSGFLVDDSTFYARWITDLSTTNKYVIPCITIKPNTEVWQLTFMGMGRVGI